MCPVPQEESKTCRNTCPLVLPELPGFGDSSFKSSPRKSAGPTPLTRLLMNNDYSSRPCCPNVGSCYSRSPSCRRGDCVHRSGNGVCLSRRWITRCQRRGFPRISHAEFATRLAVAQAWLESGRDVSTSDVIRQLGNGTAAYESCVTALYLALRFRDQPLLERLERRERLCQLGISLHRQIGGLTATKPDSPERGLT
jgi:hypothetical protein